VYSHFTIPTADHLPLSDVVAGSCAEWSNGETRYRYAVEGSEGAP